jgi:hypothetical protein
LFFEIKNTAEISRLEKKLKINQITFISPQGEKEKLIFE